MNPCRKPGEWQTYDIVFHPPLREGERIVDPGSFTVFLNGVLAAQSFGFAMKTDDPAEKFIRLWESYCYEPDRKVKALLGPAEEACVKALAKNEPCIADLEKELDRVMDAPLGGLLLRLGTLYLRGGAVREHVSEYFNILAGDVGYSRHPGLTQTVLDDVSGVAHGVRLATERWTGSRRWPSSLRPTCATSRTSIPCARILSRAACCCTR